MTLDEVYEECIKMKKDERRFFELDHDPKSGELNVLVVKIALGRKAHDGCVVALNRSERHLSAYCLRQ
jgi:hypothetical protein